MFLCASNVRSLFSSSFVLIHSFYAEELNVNSISHDHVGFVNKK